MTKGQMNKLSEIKPYKDGCAFYLSKYPSVDKLILESNTAVIAK